MDSTERAIIAERVLNYKRKFPHGGQGRILEECEISRPTLKAFLDNPDSLTDKKMEAIKAGIDRLAPVEPYSQDEMDDNAVLAALAKDLRDVGYVVGNVKLPKEFRLGRFQDFIAAYSKRLSAITKAVKDT